MTKLERNAADTIKKYGLLKKGDRIAVGVSGGADSVALLCYLISVSDEYQLELVVCHLNHNLRGDESKRDEEFVRALAERFSLPFYLSSPDVSAYAKKFGLSTEEAGRQLRYQFFTNCAGKNGLIATAHTLSDSAETLLFNIARGSGLRGLRGIPAKRGAVIRPLISCTREDIEEYLNTLGETYVTDSSNLTNDYTRNRIRHNVIPELTAINPAFLKSASELMSIAGRQYELISSLAEEAWKDCLLTQDINGLCFDRKKLASLPSPVLEELLMRIIDSAAVTPSSKTVELLSGIIFSGSGASELSPEYVFFADEVRAGLCFKQKIKTPYFEKKIAPPDKGGTVTEEIFTGKFLNISYLALHKDNCTEKFNKKLLNNCIDCDKIEGYITVRQRLPGDAFRPATRKIRKSLKKLFNEASLSLSERERLLVACDSKGIIWVEGFGCDLRCTADERSSNVIILTSKE